MSEYRIAPDGLVHIHAMAEHGHWSASFAGRPEVSFGGDTALVAAKRLLRAVDGLDESTLRLVSRSEDGRRAELTVRRAGLRICPDCHGIGRYVGLAMVEPCRACSVTERAAMNRSIAAVLPGRIYAA